MECGNGEQNLCERKIKYTDICYIWRTGRETVETKSRGKKYLFVAGKKGGKGIHTKSKEKKKHLLQMVKCSRDVIEKKTNKIVVYFNER